MAVILIQGGTIAPIKMSTPLMAIKPMRFMA
jgi:hypothetical protein